MTWARSANSVIAGEEEDADAGRAGTKSDRLLHRAGVALGAEVVAEPDQRDQHRRREQRPRSGPGPWIRWTTAAAAKRITAIAQARRLPRLSPRATAMIPRPIATEAISPAERPAASDEAEVAQREADRGRRRQQREEPDDHAQPRQRPQRPRRGRSAPARAAAARFAPSVLRRRRAPASGASRRAGREVRCRGRAVRGRGRRAVGSLVALRPQGGEEDHVADRLGAGDQHHQAVEADPEPAGRRQPVLERLHVVVVDRFGLVVAAGLQPRLRSKRSAWSTGSLSSL